MVHFTYGAPLVTGDQVVNQFVAANNPLLAFAARATSAFPFAFEPVMLGDIDEVLATRPIYQHDPRAMATRPNWDPWFSDYAAQNDSYPRRSFSDGGDMDNKPFSYIIDALPGRRWTVPVVRKVIFVEPDPAHPEREATDYDPPTVLASVVKGLSLGRVETIREDLNRLMERSRLADQVALVAQAAEGAFDASEAALPVTDDVSQAAYRRLRVLRLADDLGSVLARLRGVDETSGRADAIRLLVAAWPGRAGGGLEAAGGEYLVVEPHEFLERLDLSFRLRRLNFVSRRADRLYRADPAARAAVVEVKQGLNEAYLMLANARRALRSGLADVDLALAVAGLSLEGDDLDAVLVGPPAERVLYRIAYRMADSTLDRTVDFDRAPLGQGRNPRSYDGLSITVSDDVEGGPALTAWVVSWHGRQGLAGGRRVDIALPGPASSVRLTVAYFAEPVVVEGVDGAGARSR